MGLRRLVATLGAKSTTKKVNRKAILDVDVPKACETIIRPEAPMALRLQGNLLYGVSRVYNQQCGYALIDAQTMRDKMRAMLKEIRSSGLDPDAGKAKPDQLIIPDDPSFIPFLMLPGLNVDLSALDITSNIGSPRKSSLLSSKISESNKSSHFSDGQLHLNISSSDISGLGAGAFGLPSDIGSIGTKENEFELPAVFAEETGVLLQPDFEFDGEGNIIELPVRQTTQKKPTGLSARSETRTNTRVRPEVEEDFQTLQDQFEDQMVLHNDVEMRYAGNDNLRSGDPDSGFDSAADPSYEPVIGVSPEAAEVQQRLRKRRNKILGFDDPPELKNSDLAQWNSEYARNMALAAKLKQNNKINTLAKRNAGLWVMGERFGSVDFGFGVSDFKHPLGIFSGEQMLATLTGNKNRTSRKRSREDVGGNDSEYEVRSVRMREDEDNEIGRGGVIEHDDGYGIGFDLQDIEVGRHAPVPLYDDGSSHMPWNITASIRGSQPGSSVHSRQFLLSVGGFSSIGGPRSIASGGVPDGSAVGGSSAVFGRRMGRITSASPLAGRGIARPGMSDIPISDDEEFDLSNLDSNLVLDHSVVEEGGGSPLGLRRSQHHGSFDTQMAAETQWPAATLDQESVNFLDFVRTKIMEESERVKADTVIAAADGDPDDADVVEITFSSLLPPTDNSHVIATQAFLHTLMLATRGALCVRQEDGIRYPDRQDEFGEISMWLV
ncbi:Rad21/Rec8 N terminal domain-containing protein [Paracoccidioides lutzii Pb01]|uniref:Rad21/Rec8 N terminal domain-containing protein n=1 Tax=Paracoccidioides lutzii (strain ATCC MYA-826 / Pb01) TaxID=502779 RepID=C1H183_PARBA|nr:Rad21/Rec8 N terminal domain-containing protein [Paracoccidioides lutzii Pb01]EEH33477.2 Rad21/Rec8 N terminal domain-containing protein [Paracoccidioides lutzii Pb01]